MIQVVQNLLRTKKELDIYEKSYHGTYERLPASRDVTYAELAGSREALFISARLLQPYSKKDSELISNHEDAKLLKFLHNKLQELSAEEEFEILSVSTCLNAGTMEQGMSASALIVTVDEEELDKEDIEAIRSYIEDCINGVIDVSLRESSIPRQTFPAEDFNESKPIQVESKVDSIVNTTLNNNSEGTTIQETLNNNVIKSNNSAEAPTMKVRRRFRSLTEMTNSANKDLNKLDNSLQTTIQVSDKTEPSESVDKEEFEKPSVKEELIEPSVKEEFEEPTKAISEEELKEPTVKEEFEEPSETVGEEEFEESSVKEEPFTEASAIIENKNNEIIKASPTNIAVQVANNEENINNNPAMKYENFNRFVPKDISEDKIKTQTEAILNSEVPYLNTIDTYYPVSNIKELNENIKTYKFHNDLIDCQTIASKQSLNGYFIQTMNYSMTSEHPEMVRAMKGTVEKSRWMSELERYVDTYCKIPPQDKEIFMKRLEEAYYSYYILTCIIADKDVSDIRVTSAEDIIVKIHGKHYKAMDEDGNPVKFITEADYLRFIEMLTIRNGYNPDNPPPIMVFTDKHYNEDYILRFNITGILINSTDLPYLHIRKVAKEKTDIYKLIDAGMLDEKLASYLLDKVQTSKGLVFAGPSASGKTTLMNALIDFIPKTESILCIQESEELFTYKHPNAYFQRILKDPLGTPIIGLSQLGQNGLLCDSQYFIIGECKGAEVRDLLRASNTGHKCWCSVHSQSSMETIPRLADYVKYGADYTLQEAERMLKDLEVIVYIQNFKIMEISEIAGYDDKEQKMIYRPIYRRNYKIV
jgi:pilus assembly protein CpaF